MMKPGVVRRLLPALILLALPATPVYAQYYHVTGRVTDSQGAGVWNVNLDVFDSVTGNDVFITNDGTDQNGDYDIFLFTGTYDIEYKAPAGVRLVSETRWSISVVSPTVVDVVLPDGFFLSGRITDGQGAGIPQTDIDVDDALTGVRILTPHDKTDGNGDFRVVAPAGRVDVTYQPPAGSRAVAVMFRDVSITGDTVLDAALESGFFVSGVVVDEAGVGIEGIDLDADDLGAGIRVPTPRDNTDAAGLYEIVLPAGTFDITYDPLTRNDLAPARLHAVPITADTVLDTVTLRNGVWLSGTVTDGSGGPVVGANLDVIDPASRDTLVTLRDHTDSTGTYGTAVPPGVYDLLMMPPEGSGLGEGFAAGVSVLSDTSIDFVLGPVGIGGGPGDGAGRLPRGFLLRQNYPNPFNPRTTIRFRLPEARVGGGAPGEAGKARVRLEIFDLRGRRIRRLLDGDALPGERSVVWDGRDERGRPVASGVYLYRLRYGPWHAVRKMIMEK